jgi:deoxyribodipyrimidine photolyase-related protein
MAALVLVRGDQLSPDVLALRGAHKVHDVVLMCEVAAEASSVPHPKKKLAFTLAAMRAFADELSADGWKGDYPSHPVSDDHQQLRATRRHQSA